MYKNSNKLISKEELRTKSEKIYHTVNELARKAHKHKVIIRDHKDRHLVSFPMTLGIAGALILPIFAGLGLAAFLINDWQAALEKYEQEL